MATIAAGSILAACGSLQEMAPEARSAQTDIVPSLLESPQPLGATPQPVEPELAQFLALSSILTGFEELNPTLGRVYLESLQSGQHADALAALYRVAGATSIEALERAGVFADEQTRATADTIAEYWYTGVYTKDGEQTVATYVDALVWRAIYTKPNTICGPYTGFWQEPPE
jgi:hypothetical protein